MLRPVRLVHVRRLLYLRRWPLIAVTVGLALIIGISAVPARGTHPSLARSASPTFSGIRPSPSVAQPDSPAPTLRPTKATANRSPAASDVFAPIGSVLLSVPTQSQLPDLPNGCEVTSLSMLLTAGGIPVDKDVLAREQATDPTPPVFSGPPGDFYSISRWGNPNRAFVGNVEGYGYGIYHAPLARLLNSKTNGHALDLTGRPFSEILARLRLGTPIVVGTTSTFAPPTRWVTWTTPEGPVRATQLEHAVLLVGYTRERLVVNNPLTGRREQVSPAPFIAAWQQMGRQALTLTR
jgi:uncharacterized protein YvpB